MTGFELIILSALFHALWNVLVKVAKDKLTYTSQIHFFATIYLFLMLIIFFPDSLVFDKNTVTFACLSAFFFSLYQLFVAGAYKYADVSVIYPITTSSPLFIIIWAYLFLGERISFYGLVGILLVIFGCFEMNFVNNRGKNSVAVNGVVLAFLAAFSYSFGAMIDKYGVSNVNTMLYIFLMTGFSFIYTTTIVLFLHRGRRRMPVQWGLVSVGGLVLALSTVTYRLGLIDFPVSYASALRQLSAFFALIIGIFFFKERFGIKRAIGWVALAGGILLIKLVN